MDLRKYSLSPEQEEELRHLIGYQPFILSDDCMTGTGDIWSNRSKMKCADRTICAPEEWERFSEANLRMMRMYNDWIDEVKTRCEDFGQMTVLDTGCNAGFFLYRFREEGVSRAWGYDLNPKLVRAYEILNEITGLNVVYHNVAYDQFKHEIPNAEPADIVVSTGVMCHLSDPLYYLHFLGKLAKRMLLLFSTVDDHNRLRITYGKPRKFYKNPFPICFDNMTTVSKPLVLFALQDIGFQQVIELPYRPEWVSFEWYKQFKCFLAMR